ncbi:MAG TPA: RagB/SusD family nutrient uptake outer membrane protein [Bacteroidales bacterium]|nr:RagB/SusD family nutrient uptake outer membrane protein [Bacteroidales bacterium]
MKSFINKKTGKMKGYIISLLILFCLPLFISCELDLVPYSDLTSESLATDPSGVKGMANGCLMMMKEQLTNDPRNIYIRHLNHLTEFPSDNVMITKSTVDNLWYSFNRQHIPDQLNTSYLWYTGYKIVMEANNIIDKVKIDATSGKEIKQYLGEAYFYRAMAFFDMARVFSFPPSHGDENPGIILRLSPSETDAKARATVGETYKQIISDLHSAAELMIMREGTIDESKKYANKWAALGLLSRAFLFTGQYDSVIYYANKVIDESPFTLAPHDSYITSMWNTPSSSEAMFIIYYGPDEDKLDASLGSMYNGDSRGKGWGEVYPSQSYHELVARYPHDIRNEFIDTVYNADHSIAIYPGTTFKKFYINKFSYQIEGRPTLCSPAYIRLSEIYLNRAEAYAHLNMNGQALDDVNTIRERAGLSGEELVTLSNLTATHGYTDALDAVLTERRIELAFEGQRRDDLLRNKIDLDRSYPSAQNVNGEPEIYPYNGPRQIFYIPLAETIYNPACAQND